VRRCWRCSVRDSKAKSATRQLVPQASVNSFDLEALEQHCAAGRAPCDPCRVADGPGPSAGGTAARLEEPLTALAELGDTVVIDGVQRPAATAVQAGRS